MRKDLVARSLEQIISEISQLLEDGKTEEAKSYLSTMKEKLKNNNGKFLKTLEKEEAVQDYQNKYKRVDERKIREKPKKLSRETVVGNSVTASNSETTTNTVSALEKYLSPKGEINTKEKIRGQALSRVKDRALNRDKGKGKDKGKKL